MRHILRIMNFVEHTDGIKVAAIDEEKSIGAFKKLLRKFVSNRKGFVIRWLLMMGETV